MNSNELIRNLDLEEKLALTAGSDMWHTAAVPRCGIPRMKLSDGPSGARGKSFTGVTSVLFPCGTALAATWDPELIEIVGAAIAEDAETKGVHVLLGPTVNIHRSPLAGRHFECYSEDPHLTARIAVAFIRGVQSRGIGACVKHLVCNDSEFERMSISSEVRERALREIYLPPFEAAVREAGVWTVMSAYNRLNGTHCSEHPGILTDILREEWRFDGVVVSDWFGTKSGAPSLNAGLDLEMPGPPRFMGERLLDAARSGEVTEETVDRTVGRLIALAERSGVLEDPEERGERSVDEPRHREVARRAAGEAIVLLRNEDGVLPLESRSIRRLAVIGPNADVARTQGGGSCQVTPHYAVTPLEGIRAACGDETEALFERGCSNERGIPVADRRVAAPPGDPSARGLMVEYFNATEPSGEPVLRGVVPHGSFVWLGSFFDEVDPSGFAVRCTAVLDTTEGGGWTFSLTSAGRSRLYVDDDLIVDNWTQQTPGTSFFGAGSAEVPGYIEIPPGTKRELRVEFSSLAGSPLSGLRIGAQRPAPTDLIDRAVELARTCDAAVLVVGSTSDWETEGRDRSDLELPGPQAELIERVAAVNPRTVVVVNAGSPHVMRWADAVPAILQAWYPGQECGNAIADVLFGEVNPSGKLPTTFPERLEDNPAHENFPGEFGEVVYGEGVFVGYRFYEHRAVTPRFGFGHGLSYTTFEYGEPICEPANARPGEQVDVSLDVSNTGKRAGAEGVQLYVAPPRGPALRPPKELKAFTKVWLEPGETKRVRLSLDPRAFAFYDPRAQAWSVVAGNYELACGSSSADIRCSTSVRIEESETLPR